MLSSALSTGSSLPRSVPLQAPIAPAPRAPADAVVVGSGLDLVDALLASGSTNVVLASSHEAFRDAIEQSADALVVVDARARPHLLGEVCCDPDLLAGRTVVLRGGTLDERDRTVIASAGSVVWCSGGLPAPTVVRLARLHRPS